jgi:predicted dinucleotide-utilizing enzyme
MHRANRTPLGIGLIGLGRHGSRYARHLLNDVPEGRLTAVCRRHIHEGSGLPAGSTAACYADYRELIADSRVDAVVIVTPPALNREISLAVAAAGKPFLIEKPLAPTLDDARAIASAAAQCGCIAMTAPSPAIGSGRSPNNAAAVPGVRMVSERHPAATSSDRKSERRVGKECPSKSTSLR